MILPEIRDDDLAVLMFALGTAYGEARNRRNEAMATAIVRLSNSLMRNEPSWRPFWEGRQMRPPIERAKYARRSLEERFNVSRWTPPPEATSAAKERTLDIVMAYLYDGARYDGLFTMAESCYLQGVNDSVEAILKTGHKIVRVDAEKD